MKRRIRNIDNVLLTFFGITIFAGLYSFISSSFGIFEKSEIKFYSVFENQMLAYFLCIFVFIITISLLKPRFYFIYATYIYAISIIAGLAVKIPGIGVEHGGANRWLNLGIIQIQPSDLLKVSLIIMLASFIHNYSNKLSEMKYTIVYGLIVLIPTIVLVLQKDLGAITVIFGIAGILYFLDENRSLRYIGSLIAIACIFIGVYVWLNPYTINRIKTFYNSSTVNSNEKYQSDQATIAIAKGGWIGEGPFQGVQKYKYLPEPAGDSVFGTVGEEIGFVGSSLVLFCYFVFLIRSIMLSHRVKETFSKMLIIGIISHFLIQIILNVGSMLAIIPFSGDVLPFFSHGGTALIINIFEAALILRLTSLKNKDNLFS